MRSRGEAAAAEISRLTAAQQEAAERADQASRAFTALETKVAGLDAGEHGLDAEHEAAVQTLDGIERQQAELRRQEQVASQERAALAARVEALRVGLDGKDGSSALLAATDRLDGLLGSVAALIKVQSPYETAIAAAFGAAADAVAVTGVPAAVDAFDHLKAEDLGRAGLLIGDLVEAERVSEWPALPASARYAIEVVDVPDTLAASVQRILRKVALVEDLAAAQRLVAGLPDVVAVTPHGDVLSAHFAAGGSSATPHSSSCSLPLTTPSGAGPKPVMHVIGSVSPRASWMSSIVRQAPRSRSRLLDCMNLTRRWQRLPKNSASSARLPAPRTQRPIVSGTR